MKDEYGLDTEIPYSERDLIQRAIKQAKPFAAKTPRWVMVKHVFGTNHTVSTAICTRYGFDPDQELCPLAKLSEDEYEENLLQHGIIR